METENKVYLGDGLYAELVHRGWMIRLSAPRDGGTHWVALEPEVFDALCQFAVASGWGNIMRDALRKEDAAGKSGGIKSASTSK